MEGDTVSEAASSTENGTGPPEGTGENVVVMEDEKGNGVAEAEKEPEREAIEMEEECGGKVEKVKGEEGGPDEEKEREEKMEGGDGDAKVDQEEKESKGNGGSDLKADMESKGEVNEDEGTAETEGEGDAKEEDKRGEVEKKDDDSKEEVKDDVGSAEMEEEGDVKEEDEHVDVEKKAQESKEEKGLKKRRRGQRGERKRKEEKGEVKKKALDEEKGDAKKKEVGGDKGAKGKRKVDEEKVAVKKEEKDEKRGEAKKRKVDGDKGDAKKFVDEKKADKLSTPVVSSVDRPVRERKSVERLVVAIENEPVKEFLIHKGRGTPLKDIPNVAYKLSKKKSDDTVKLLHAVIYGRRGKASQIKSNISQFSGFVWHDNEEKQQAKIKERLDKYVKNKLIEFCDVLDIPIAKATVRKEDLVSKILDFLMAPHATTDVLLTEMDQPNKGNKRKRTVNIGASKKSGSTTAKRSPRKRRKIGEDEEEQEDGEKNENGIPDADVDEPSKHSESEKDESEEEDDEDLRKRKHGFNESSKKKSAEDVSVKRARTPKKVSLEIPAESAKKTYARQPKPKTDDTSDTSPKVFSRKKKNDDTPKKQPSTPSKSTPKAKTGKRVAKEKDKPKKKDSGPSEEELRKTICEILKDVDFNTATFTDILKQLTRHFNTDLTPRKSAIKLMIHDELTRLADEAEDDEDDESDDEKEDISKPAGKKVET